MYTVKIALAALAATFLLGGFIADHDAEVEAKRQFEAPYTPRGFDTNNDSGSW